MGEVLGIADGLADFFKPRAETLVSKGKEAV